MAQVSALDSAFFLRFLIGLLSPPVPAVGQMEPELAEPRAPKRASMFASRCSLWRFLATAAWGVWLLVMVLLLMLVLLLLAKRLLFLRLRLHVSPSSLCTLQDIHVMQQGHVHVAAVVVQLQCGHLIGGGLR